MALAPQPRVHPAHRRAYHQPQMIDAESLGDQAVLGLDHVQVAVTWEMSLEAIAGLARLAMPNAVRQYQVELLCIEQPARAKQLARERGAHVLITAAARAVEDEYRVLDDALSIALRL